MQLRYKTIFLFSICIILSINVFAQNNDYLNFYRFLNKFYVPSKAIKTYCEENYAIVYFKLNNKKIDSIYSQSTLGQIIANDLQFEKKYTQPIKTDKHTIAMIFILNNINPACIVKKNGFNTTSLLIKNLLKKISSQSNEVEFFLEPYEINFYDTRH